MVPNMTGESNSGAEGSSTCRAGVAVCVCVGGGDLKWTLFSSCV